MINLYLSTSLMDTDQSTAGAQSKLKTNNKTCLNLSLKHVKTNIICLWLKFQIIICSLHKQIFRSFHLSTNFRI